jgi:hypothetical protein
MSMGAYYTAGVGNLSITTDCNGYSYLCQVPQKKLMPWTISKTVFLHTNELIIISQ